MYTYNVFAHGVVEDLLPDVRLIFHLRAVVSPPSALPSFSLSHSALSHFFLVHTHKYTRTLKGVHAARAGGRPSLRGSQLLHSREAHVSPSLLSSRTW